MTWVDGNNYICAGNVQRREKVRNFPWRKRVFPQTLVDFAGLFELEGDGFMSRVRLFVEVRVNLNVRGGRDVYWGRRGVDGGRVKVCHLAA